MEMKDKLKKLRSEKNLTQAQLADILHVSRSTVAKWENGLGLPNPDSLEALEALYGISKEEVATSEPEAVIVSKNRKLHAIGQVVGWVAMLAIVAINCVLPFAIHKGRYGFTAEMVAGAYADDAYIDTGDYRIYYSTFAGDWEDGRHWEILSGWKPVEKHFWGWTVSEEDYDSEVITLNNYVVGRLTSIRGDNGYYNIIKTQISENMAMELVTAKAVRIKGENYKVQHSFFFITPEPVTFFFVGDTFFRIE